MYNVFFYYYFIVIAYSYVCVCPEFLLRSSSFDLESQRAHAQKKKETAHKFSTDRLLQGGFNGDPALVDSRKAPRAIQTACNLEILGLNHRRKL